jgi:hypothetical protein
MTLSLAPSSVVLAFFFGKTLVYPELILLLALIRCATATGAARAVAAVTVLCAGTIVFVVFAPSLNLHTGAWYPVAARILDYGQGLTVLCALSALFAVSAWLPGRGRVWIDWAHALLVLVMLGLWLATRL